MRRAVVGVVAMFFLLPMSTFLAASAKPAPATRVVVLYEGGVPVRSWTVTSVESSPGRIVLDGGETVILGPAVVVVSPWK